MLTPAQCRAARALLHWSQERLADASQVGVTTIRVFELETSSPRRMTLLTLRRALEDGGVIFIDADLYGPGVRLREVK